MSADEIYDVLKEKFGDAILEIASELPIDPIISVDPLKMDEIAKFLRDDDKLQFDSIMNLSGVDDNNPEKIKNEDGTVTEKAGTLSVVYHLHSIFLKHKVALKTSASSDNPEIESVTNVWAAANWHEREAYDMFGIKFLNHPDLTRILMPYDWEGYPLRKNYENPEFYEGMKIPY